MKKTNFVCQECGYVSSGWMGRCPNCLSWGTLVEEISEKRGDKRRVAPEEVVPIAEIEGEEFPYIPVGIGELDRVLGGGVVKGGTVLVGGDPGIGKSTLMLQLCAAFCRGGGKALYVACEESSGQIAMRARRVRALVEGLFVMPEIELTGILERIEELKPELVVVDSIQAVHWGELSSAPGSVGQVRACAARFVEQAKKTGFALFLVGHVTKEGLIAGPRVLEHMVDTVLYFEGGKASIYRILRAFKNRFGSTNEVAVFKMSEHGLEEVGNPSRFFLQERALDVPGSCVVAALEGTRALLVELQALVSPTSYSVPRRMVQGLDYNRAALLLAVLERQAGLVLHDKDVFLNLAGGARIFEPAMDLGVCVAVASSLKGMPVPGRTVIFGEVGLAGEVRSVEGAQLRVAEAERLGFDICVLPKGSAEGLESKLQLIPVGRVQEALDMVLG